jgi:hypothetical protein
MTGARRRQSPVPGVPRTLDWRLASGGVYADRMRAGTIEKNKFEVLKKHALQYDVEPDGDYMRPGNNPAEAAFQLLRCGVEMLLVMADHGFPTLDSRLQKKVGKYIRQALLYYGDSGALIFGQLVPLLYVKVGGRLSGEEPPELTVEHHRKLFQTASSFYPYKKDPEMVDKCLREFKVLEEHDLPEPVLSGERPANEYAQAIMRGENPDDDPRLVALQQDWARDFFIERAATMAIKRAFSPNDRKLLNNRFDRAAALEEPAATEFRDRLRNAWIQGCQPYLEYAVVDA